MDERAHVAIKRLEHMLGKHMGTPGGPPKEFVEDMIIVLNLARRTLTKEASMNFGQAIESLKAGKKVSRSGWNGKSMWLALQVPDEHSKMSLPYIYMFTADKKLVPWLASQTDMLAEDWSEILVTE